MPLTLEVITPEGKVFSKEVDTVVVPTDEGDIGILPGHIPVLCAVAPGELSVVSSTGHEYLAVDKGFVRVQADLVSILTEAAIDVKHIDLDLVVQAQARAEEALKAALKNPSTDAAELEKMEAVARFAIAQQLVKSRH